MRKTVILLLSAAFVAALPAVASAKQKRVRYIKPAPVVESSPGARFVGNALYQIFVPWEQTFGPRRVIEKKVRVRHAARRRAKNS